MVTGIYFSQYIKSMISLTCVIFCLMQLAHDGRVKLADVGVTKHERDITGTVCGTSLYLAPEVFEGRIYNSKADMYSFGFVLWELWYGKTAFQDMVVMKSPSAVVLLEEVRGGLRPAHIEGAFPDPWSDWKKRHGVMLEEGSTLKVESNRSMGMFSTASESGNKPQEESASGTSKKTAFA